MCIVSLAFTPLALHHHRSRSHAKCITLQSTINNQQPTFTKNTNNTTVHYRPVSQCSLSASFFSSSTIINICIPFHRLCLWAVSWTKSPGRFQPHWTCVSSLVYYLCFLSHIHSQCLMQSSPYIIIIITPFIHSPPPPRFGLSTPITPSFDIPFLFYFISHIPRGRRQALPRGLFIFSLPPPRPSPPRIHFIILHTLHRTQHTFIFTSHLFSIFHCPLSFFSTHNCLCVYQLSMSHNTGSKGHHLPIHIS